MTTDAEYIQSVVDEAWRADPECPWGEISRKLAIEIDFRAAVARHLLERDPQCVRIPLVGEVS